MKKHYTFFAKWRKIDVKFLNQFKTSREVEEGYCSFYVEETIYFKIMEFYSKKCHLFKRIRPPEFSVIPSFVSFSKEELNKANSFCAVIGNGRLNYIWDDSTAWQQELYNDVCEFCFMPIGAQQKPWVLKRDLKLKKHEFLGFEGLPGYVFCNIELAILIKKEFGIEHIEVLVGKKKRISDHLVQLKIPISPYKLIMDNNLYGEPYESNDWICCNSCGQYIYTNQERDFFPPFEEQFEFDLVLTQEWFGWYRRIILSKRFLEFCFEHKLLKKWKSFDSRFVPQITM